MGLQPKTSLLEKADRSSSGEYALDTRASDGVDIRCDIGCEQDCARLVFLVFL